MVTVLDGVRLARFDSQFIFPRRVYAPGEYRVPIVAAGNSLLSSLFVPALDVGASLEVRYVQSTAGQPETEETFVVEHRTITAPATQADQTLATKIHDKAVAIATVTGGNVTFGVRATVVDQFATDLDAALKFDGQAVNLLRDKGLPIAALDELTGQWRFVLADDGGLRVSGAFALQGVNKTLSGFAAVAPSVTEELISYTVPPGQSFTLLSGMGSALGDMRFVVLVDGVEILRAFNSFFDRNVKLSLDNPLRLTAGQVLKVEATGRSVFGTTNEANAFLYGSEE